MAATPRDLEIGRRVARLRKSRGWSMAELGARCPGPRVTPSQINKLEKGWQQFTYEWLYRLSQALECPVEQLISDTAPDLSPREQVLLSRIRGLAEPDIEALERVVSAMSRQETEENP